MLYNPTRGRITTYDSEFIPRPFPRDRPTRRPPVKEKLLREAEKVPKHLEETNFVVNRSEIADFARENSVNINGEPNSHQEQNFNG